MLLVTSLASHFLFLHPVRISISQELKNPQEAFIHPGARSHQPSFPCSHQMCPPVAQEASSNYVLPPSGGPRETFRSQPLPEPRKMHPYQALPTQMTTQAVLVSSPPPPDGHRSPSP